MFRSIISPNYRAYNLDLCQVFMILTLNDNLVPIITLMFMISNFGRYATWKLNLLDMLDGPLT